MKPLDGRVADVNRRVTETTASVSAVSSQVDELASKLGAYTVTTTESNTYLGSELRRVDGALSALGDSLDTVTDRLDVVTERIDVLTDRDYVERLAAAVDIPLAQLDGATANLINHASGHRGFAAQRGLWFNPPVTVQLGEGSAQLGDVNERIVEVPWAFCCLARLRPGARVLEIGSAESTFALSVASLGYRVTTIDIHPLPYSHPNLEAVAARFEDWEGPAEPFDAVFLISTIEHFGLGAYEEPVEGPGADRAAVERVAELLSDEGFLVLTTPYGTPRVDALERVYDADGLGSLLAGWTIVERTIAIRTDTQTWVPLADDQLGEQRDRPGVAMVIAHPPREA